MSDTEGVEPEVAAAPNEAGPADQTDEDRPTFLVVRQDDPPEEQDGATEEVDHPSKLLRIATMVQSMLNQVKTTELDEAGRERLAEIHNRSLSALSGLISDDLRDELEEVALATFTDERTPSASELRVAQAQLVGWLEGLFRGIQASMATQHMAAQAAQMKALRQGGQGDQPPGGGGAGQYL
ncbi:MAG: bacterial proteasome activator family protein [Actinobacteria bacterium]|nr:bacterial proteasome activator family protein [Actinomycetota bacterium]